MFSRVNRKTKVFLTLLAIFSLSIWWVTAPRYIHIPIEAVDNIDACVQFEEKYPEKDIYTMDEFRDRGEAIKACREAKMRYYEENRSGSMFGYLLQPPMLIDQPPQEGVSSSN